MYFVSVLSLKKTVKVKCMHQPDIEPRSTARPLVLRVKIAYI